MCVMQATPVCIIYVPSVLTAIQERKFHRDPWDKMSTTTIRAIVAKNIEVSSSEEPWPWSDWAISQSDHSPHERHSTWLSVYLKTNNWSYYELKGINTKCCMSCVCAPLTGQTRSHVTVLPSILNQLSSSMWRGGTGRWMLSLIGWVSAWWPCLLFMFMPNC